jgi:site-specific DNA-methyltransferase (adenine-specific)
LKFTAYMRTTGLTAKQLNEATDTYMGSHYLTSKSQPAIPTPELWQIIRPLCGDIPAWVDELVERIAAEREVTGTHKQSTAQQVWMQNYSDHVALPPKERKDIPATPAAEQWQGWGTALKPAHEPIVVARKPLIGTVAENVLTHGTGALNIDGCRIGTDELKPYKPGLHRVSPQSFNDDDWVGVEATKAPPAGRWPANVILDESQAAELDKQSGVQRDGVAVRRNGVGGGHIGPPGAKAVGTPDQGYGGAGGASRFFYVAKAGKKERPNVDGVAHPTVKPLTLLRYLVRLVTPPGGTVLEPFAGSGTTVEACILEGFNCIAIEMTDDYLPLIAERVRRSTEDKEGRLL